jgi:hypothetical protein
MCRVQQRIARTERLAISQKAYPTIVDGMREMARRIRIALIGKPHWRVDNNFKDMFYILDENGRILREFTLVARKGDAPIPFDHLLNVDRPTYVKTICYRTQAEWR